MKENLPYIEVRTTPNGYLLTTDATGTKHEYMYFDECALLFGFIHHIIDRFERSADQSKMTTMVTDHMYAMEFINAKFEKERNAYERRIASLEKELGIKRQ